MDDVDGAQGAIARTMLRTGDWVTGRLDGVIFLDKAPLKYWITAILYQLFGIHDWVARIPNALAVVALCVTIYRIGRWAGAAKAGFYAGLVLATSIGLFLFTRVVIPDVILTLAITLSLWGFLRTLEDEHPSKLWTYAFYFFSGCGMLLKGLIGIVFPAGIAFVYLLVSRRLLDRPTWKRLRPGTGILVFLAVAVPWHVLAILQNPPYFDWTLHAGDHFGYKFRGFFWFYFINDQVLRFTGERWPRDYNTVPRLLFWLYELLWFFPWSLTLVATRARDFVVSTRMGRLRVLALIWVLFVMLFFTFSTTQEYYSMPIYPALALLIGSAMTRESAASRLAFRVAGLITGVVFIAMLVILAHSWNVPAPGDISRALSNNPDVYTLALGHMTDLTVFAFAYLRTPLTVAAIAFLIGTVALWMRQRAVRYAGVVVMLMIFFQAARLALITFDPYMSSYPVAAELNKLPKATLIFNSQYYDFSSIPFYTDYHPLLLNGRYFNLEYGSYAPGAPHVFIDNQDFRATWESPQLAYVVTDDENLKSLQKLVPASHLHLLIDSGGKSLYSNQAISPNKS